MLKYLKSGFGIISMILVLMFSVPTIASVMPDIGAPEAFEIETGPIHGDTDVMALEVYRSPGDGGYHTIEQTQPNNQFVQVSVENIMPLGGAAGTAHSIKRDLPAMI